MHDAASIKSRLLGQLETVLHHLFPNGKPQGHEFCIGSLSGEPGASLKVSMRGETAGVWKDFATGEAGDIFSLWMGARSLPFLEALREASTFLGISNVERPPQKPRPPPPDMSGVGRMKGTPVFEYLQGRGIAEETMRLYQVRSHYRRSDYNKHFIAFTFCAPDGTAVFLKSTGIAKKPDGKKDIWSTPPWFTLWGWWLVKPHHREICITEGEIDAMTMHQLFVAEGIDIPCLSMPSGAANLDWIENDYDALNQFEKIWIVPDNDPAGNEAAPKIAHRLGPGRCLRIRPPGTLKDPNALITDGTDEQKEAGVAPWFEKAESFNPPALQTVEDIWAGTVALMERRMKDSDTNHFIFPEFAYQYRDGEMSIISGYKGSGKSTWAYQTHLHEMRNGHRVLFCSWEIEPEEMLAELLWMITGHKPSAAEREAAKPFLSRTVVFIRPPRTYGLTEVCDDITYAAQRYGASRVLVDSLHYLAPKEAYELQDLVAVTMHKLAKKLGVHLALVCHSAKGEPDKIPYQVEGSGGIIKAPDNVLVVWRNFTKEEQIEKAQEKADETLIAKAKALHDGLVVCWHQRLTGKHPRLKLWFSDVSRCYRTTPEEQAPPALPGEPVGELF